MDVLTRLEAHFDEEQAAIRRRNVEAVMERANEIRSRRRLLAVAVPAAAAVVVVAGVVAAMRSDLLGGVPAIPQADQVADQNAVLEISQEALALERGDATLGWLHRTTADGSVLYALSTAPGVTWEAFPNGNLPQAIYSTTDGVGWTSALLPTPWVTAIGANGGLLYAVGTAPSASGEGVSMQVGVSSDGGATFETMLLPSGGSDEGFLAGSNVAATDNGVLVFGTRLSDDERRTSHAFWSADGQEFENVPYPFGDGWIDQVFQVGDAVVVSESAAAAADRYLLHVSEDGRTWRTMDAPPGMSWILAVGEFDDKVVAVGSGLQGSGFSVQTADDIGGPWEPLALQELLQAPETTGIWANSAHVSANGVALAVSADGTEGENSNLFTDIVRRVLPGNDVVAARSEMSASGAVLVSTDLSTWSLLHSAELGGIADWVWFAPDGRLTATFHSFDRGRRQQATIQP